jgi:(+)-abscisic acid 8'-hydroxylase
LKARKRLSEIVSEIICGREEKKLLQKDLLGCLMNSREERGKTALTKDQIADNIIGVLFAAQDTTASVLTWILKYLHDDPKLLEAVKVRVYIFHENSAIHLQPNYLIFKD